MSSDSTASFRQEMPPKGGYADIQYGRVLPQKLFKNWTLMTMHVVMTGYALYYMNKRRKYMGKLMIERFDHFNAIEPLIQAERDRAYLRHLRYNREVERDLMKRVPDWKVGTLWGRPVYSTLPDGALPDVTLNEFYAHRHSQQWRDYVFPDKWT
ncbi:NADH dehydrogenase [ubiquinone] 1 alpha subcomplex subunit 13-like [Oppia nitens]|uniref:NADH dehydrogenase [ubiquinone] 1 alpha subcomplex subunit 13-like n=1 Tax=Oppia nitens TaxID=1686743 RepID=UPI0023DA7BE0|nr:NADH dehydrogenase [ubiquinone] 1 alpha subcomplex subunit 13-like [Oppia nitens]